MSQLDLALEAGISQRHLSFIESGRAVPSREMLLHLTERLDVSLRHRNTILLAGGFAPVFPERGLDHPAMAELRATMERLLESQEPFPALAIDRHWNMVAANRMVAPLLEGVAAQYLVPPVNILRLSLSSDGLAPRIENFDEWRGHLCSRVRRQRDHADDPGLEALHAWMLALPGRKSTAHDSDVIAVPLRLCAGGRTLSFLSSTMVFGAPLDVTLSELAIELFLPADEATADALRLASTG